MTQFIIEQGPQETNSTIYNQTDIFHVPERGYIKMMYLLITYSANGVIIPKTNLTAFETHEYITLDSYTIPFCFDNHVYGPSRVSQLRTDLYKQIKEASSTSSAIPESPNSVSLVRPLFFTAFDNNKILATDGLTVRAITKSSKSLMGFTGAGDLVSISVKLKIVYEQTGDYVFRPLRNTYNARMLPSVSLATNSTNYRMKIKCPFDVISLMFMVKVGQVNKRITSVNLSFPNGEYGNYSGDTDYTLNSDGSMQNYDSNFIISFGNRSDSEVIKMNRQMNPNIADITFDGPTLPGSVLYCVIEYKSKLDYSDDQIVEAIEDTWK